jgi:transcription elongation factor GreA
MRERVPMTRGGYETLQKELKNLKSRVRPQVIEAIRIAREHGDLSENAEYHAAKEQQGLVEAKIRQLEDKIARAQVIDTKGISSDRVVFGATIVLTDLITGEEKTFQLVGEDEVDHQKGKISIKSPVGRALVGHKVGQLVRVEVPKGTVEYEIKDLYFE